MKLVNEACVKTKSVNEACKNEVCEWRLSYKATEKEKCTKINSIGKYLTIIEWGWARYEELLITANWGLDNSSYCAKTEFNNCFIIYLKNSKQTFVFYLY
jgi:hypothetical protein